VKLTELRKRVEDMLITIDRLAQTIERQQRTIILQLEWLNKLGGPNKIEDSDDKKTLG
jgi:hypothetical protein